MTMRLTPAEEAAAISWKEWLHAHPEQAFREYETTAFIKARLDEMGVEQIDSGLETGAIGVLRGGTGSRAVLLRADIDAIRAKNEALLTPEGAERGFVHGCGHDFHTASLLAAALLLKRAEFDGTVYLLFQPAEESVQGSEKLEEAGALDRCRYDAAFALHTEPNLAVGEVDVATGPVMASKDNFRIALGGRAGHSSNPQDCIDPIVCAAAIINAVQTIVSKSAAPAEKLVCGVFSIHSGTPDNIVDDSLVMTGSIRADGNGLAARARARLETIVAATAAAYGCTVELTYPESTDATVNDASLRAVAESAAAAVCGAGSLRRQPINMAAEDFSRYARRAPTWFYRLGTAPEEPHPWHHPLYQADPAALKYGAPLMAESAVRFLKAD